MLFHQNSQKSQTDSTLLMKIQIKNENQDINEGILNSPCIHAKDALLALITCIHTVCRLQIAEVAEYSGRDEEPRV